MRRIVIIVQAAVFLVLMITACGISVAQSSEIPRSWTMSNDKAKAALSGDATAISALADDALQGSLILQHLSTVEPNIKNVLVSAEVAYRAKQHPGVKDASVAAMINAIAQKIGAPAFAYTNCAEVRRVRMRMMPLVPALFARDLKRSDGKGGFRIRQTLSPMEAVYLFASVIDQKLWNPDFQLTSQERRAKWAELHSTRSLRPSQANPRTNDLFSALETAATQESAKDLARFACDGLTRMLVARIPEGGK